MWRQLGNVTDKRRESLNYAIKDEMLVEPLFATFEEGLEFCINTYNHADAWVEDSEGEAKLPTNALPFVPTPHTSKN